METATPKTFVETVDSPELLKHLDFFDHHAEITVPGVALSQMPFQVEQFVEDDEYWLCVDDIKAHGYDSSIPIHLRPARGGTWLVDLDDAPRYMAARHVAADFFANLFSRKVTKVRFVLHESSIDGRFKAPKFEFGGGD